MRSWTSKKSSTTKLPSSLHEQLEERSPLSGPDGSRLTHKQRKELDKRFKVDPKNKVSKVAKRKELRKLKRQAPKIKRKEANERKSLAAKEKDKGGISAGVANDSSKDKHAKSNTSAKKDTTKELSSTVHDDATTTRKKLEKIQRKNPALFQMLQSTSVGIESGLGGRYGVGGGVGAWSADGSTPFDKDDEDIEYYSRKLGIKTGKELKNSLKKDGLDDLFDSLDWNKKPTKGGDNDTLSEPVKEKISDLKALQQRPSKAQLAAMKEQEKEKEEKSAAKARVDSKKAVAKTSNVSDVKDKSGNGKAGKKKPPVNRQSDPDEDNEDEEHEYDQYMDVDLAASDNESDDFDLGMEDSDASSEGDFDFGSEAEVSDVEFNEGDESEEDADAMNEDSEAQVENPAAPASESVKKKGKEVKGKDVSLSAAVPTTTAATKYIPPRLRAKVENQSEQYMRLKRQIQGLLNRLSDSNMESIVTGLEECYRNNSRHDVTEIITEATITFIADHANLLDSFVMTYAALLSSLFNLIGIEFGAYLTQTTVQLYLKTSSESAAATASSDSSSVTEKSASSKQASNLVTLLAHLYNFGIVACTIVYDIVRECLARMREADVETILKMLRVCGARMRGDDPRALKDIVALVHERSMGVTKDPLFQTPRVKFMIETIMDLKNNKHKSVIKKKGGGGIVVAATGGRDGAATGLQQDKLSKFISNLLRRRGVPDREPLRVSLDDIRSVDSKGKWWLVGAAWAGHQEDGSTVKRTDSSNISGGTGASLAAGGVQDNDDDGSADLLKLAKKQRMTTDIRRSIFVALMGAEDFVDAHEKLTRLGLKQKQEREIVRVLLHCCTNEQTYNPYYYLVATKFCASSHGYKVTFQYSLWDSVREFETGSGDDSDNDEQEDGDGEDGDSANKSSKKTLRRVSHLAKLYSALVAGGFLSLTILKGLDFASLGTYPALFCQLFFSHLLTSNVAPASVNNSQSTTPEGHVRGIFEKLKRLKESIDLCEGIEFFLEQYVLPRGKEGKPRMGVVVDSLGLVSGGKNSDESIVDLLKRRVRLAREVLVEETEYD